MSWWSVENHTVVVRNCALDSGGTTKDVEIGVLDHCGWAHKIEYDGVKMDGCLMTCDDDGCNKALKNQTTTYLSMPMLVLSIFCRFFK